MNLRTNRSRKIRSRYNKKIKSAGEKNNKVVGVKKMKKTEIKILGNKKQQVMLKKGKIYISKNEKLRTKIIWLPYYVLVAKYEERQKITKLVTRNY